MDNKKLEVVKTRTGFIAALDQSGGSSAKTLEKYGIKKDEYQTEEEMFDLIHQMRTRVITSDVFNDNHILGTILFYKTMMGKIEGEYSADYLWNKKNIVSFLKVDKGLEEEENGVKLMKTIPDLENQLDEANEKHVFGTKMRSVIYEANEKGKEFLNLRGISNMKATYYLKEGGIVTINYAYEQNGVTIYPDLIKVKVALDNGEILGVETSGYLNNHTERTFTKAKISIEEAKSKLNKSLEITSEGMAIIPTEWKTEILCYEFKGKIDDTDFLVYTNVETGREENILVIIDMFAI